MSGTGTNTIKLSRPITAHGQETTEITLRPPEVQDMIDIGTPLDVVADGNDAKISIDAKKVASYIVRLGAIPMSSVKSMALPDFIRAQTAVVAFFGDSQGEALQR